MFLRASTLVLAIAASAIAAPDGTSSVTSSQCDVGEMQCCNSVQDPSSAAEALGLLGIVNTVEGLVGWNCSPITALGLGGSTCEQEPVCCTDNTMSGLVNLGCSPVNVNV